MDGMDKTSMVILKGTESGLVYEPNKFYRHCLDVDYDFPHMIYGASITKEAFNEYFEYAHERIMRDWTKMNLVVDGKPVTKKEFKELADVHTYGSGRKNLKIIFFGATKDCRYGFYPMQGSKAANLNEAYNMYLDTINGNMEYIDDKDIQFGNTGIPIGYGDLRVWKTDTSKSIL